MSKVSSSLSLGYMAFAILATACSSDPTQLSNSAAATVVRETWKEEARLFSLGHLQFRHGNSIGPGFTMASKYPQYRAMADKGLLKLEQEQDLSGRFTGWNDFFALTQLGVQRTAVVSLTPEGAKLGTPLEKNDAVVRFAVGSYEVDKVVSNEPMEINGDKYRVVQGTHVFDVKPEFTDVLSDSGEPTYRDRRFRVLLKYDPFDSNWKLQIADVGPRDVEFQSQNVPTALARLRLAGGR